MQRKFTLKLDAIKNDKYQMTPQGFLRCDARVTRAGIFEYVEDGRRIREYRSPEEVFSRASLDTLRLVPLTFLHPAEKVVTVDNVRQRQVGGTGENITHDDEFVTCTVQITDKDTVAYVLHRQRSGKEVELSCGYDAEVIPTPGTHPKEGHYDAVQKNIRYNHLSIVPRGRAGSSVKLKLDEEENNVVRFIKKALKVDGFSMDAIDQEVPKEAGGVLGRISDKLDEAVVVIGNQAARVVELTAKVDAHQAKIDTLTEENKTLKADNAGLLDPAGEVLQGLVAGRRALEDMAGALEIKADGLDNQAIKVAVIQKSSPEFKADGKSEEYINARYDAVVELMGSAKKDGNNRKLGDFVLNAKKADAREKKDPRAEFIRKSDALANGEPEK